MLPKLEIHFNNEVLHIPQNKKINFITFAHKRDTLKENILECYTLRTLNVKKQLELKYDYNITLEDVEQQIVKDLQEFGDDFVFETAWRAGELSIICDAIMYASYFCFYDWISDEDEVFEGIIE